nr:hypothetical protein [Tanacetum cinerariifolium]
MRDLREDTFSGNKNNYAYKHVERILDIVSLFNIPGITHDAIMLPVFSTTFTGATQRWVDRLSPRTINTWDCSKMPSFNAVTNKLDSPGRDMKKVKENVHAIQVGCENFRGAHLNKECSLNEEVSKEIKEGPPRILPCQLPPKELNPKSFTLPYTIETNMLVEMADMTKKAPVGIVENVLVKIDKFLFLSYFMIIDMLGIHNEPYSSSLDEYKAVFDNEIEQLVNECELRIGNKGISWTIYGRNVNRSMGVATAEKSIIEITTASS